VILSLANVGADALRLDTVDFLWKEPDTTCRNRPQAQLILQALRAALRIAAPGVALDVGATGMTEDLPAPFGTGIHAGRVGDLSPHPGLMVHLWSALATGDATLARQALTMPAPKPVTTAWVTYARDHDDIDWAISDQDAARAGLSGDAHRDYLADFYAGRSPRSFARGSDVRTGPAPGERRTSGSLASLAGVESAKAPGADPADLDRALGRVFLLHAVLYGYGGIPRLTMGDELGLCSNHNGGTPDAGEDTDADTATSADTDTTGNAPGRHRLALPWDVAERRHDPDSTEGRIFSGLAHLARVRTGLPGLHASVEAVPVDVGNRAVLGLLRRHPAGELIQLYNVSGTWQRVPFEVLDRARPPAGTPRSDLQRWEFISAFEPTPAPGDGDGTGDGNGNGDDAPALALPPYAAWWVGFRPAP
jgi:amylosucrase